jgi:hypothetical protein
MTGEDDDPVPADGREGDDETDTFAGNSAEQHEEADPFAGLDAPDEGDASDASAPDGEDPLDGLSDAVGDGDPFAGLGEWDDAEAPGADDMSADVETTLPGGFEPVDEPDVAAFDVDEPPESDPFSEMAPDFAELDLGDVDEDEVWEALSAAEARGSVADVNERTYAEVEKHTYCERCEHFTGPPETACTNDGTEILAFVDMETVRVVDCPVVAERRRLEREH